jgi:flagellar motor switch protein FliN/FliY
MSEILSQEEIDALLRMDDKPEVKSPSLTPEEMDVLGEVGNINMGTAATTMSILLNRKVMITTPVVSLTTVEELQRENPRPCVAVEISYTQGLEGSNLLIMKDNDVKLITDLMMGGTGEYVDGDLNEMHLSAIAEIMNQMMGSSSTSLAQVFDCAINISPPKPTVLDFHADDLDLSVGSDELIMVAFKMEIEGLLESQIMQLMTLPFARMLVEKLYSTMNQQSTEPQVKIEALEQEAPAPSPKPQPAEQMGTTAASGTELRAAPREATGKRIDVKPVQFQSFDTEEPDGKVSDNLDIILDIPMQVTVELGRTKKEVGEILKLGTGSIIELDRLAGEPVDILVNGKYIARGEVVVIGENFGVRISDILSPSKRIPRLG